MGYCCHIINSYCVRLILLPEVLFRLYPDIKECYDRYLELVQIYNLRINDRPTLMSKLARWYDKVYKMKLKCFNTVLQTFMNNYQTILNYFDKPFNKCVCRVLQCKSKSVQIAVQRC